VLLRLSYLALTSMITSPPLIYCASSVSRLYRHPELPPKTSSRKFGNVKGVCASATSERVGLVGTGPRSHGDRVDRTLGPYIDR
jgi:hypothetical protein